MSFQRNLLSFQRYLFSEVKKVNTDVFYWGFPLAAGFGWFIWDAIDEEFLVSLHLAPDPELPNKRVEAARLARLEALKQKPASSAIRLTTPVAVKEADEPEDVEEEEEEAPVEEKEDPPTEEAEDEAPVEEEDVPAGEDGDDDAAEEEEESEVVIQPLYDPVKGKKLGKKDIWDNFTIKALNMGDDDDDDDDEEEEEEDEEAGTLISHFFLLFIPCDSQLTNVSMEPFCFERRIDMFYHLYFFIGLSWNESFRITDILTMTTLLRLFCFI